MAAQCRPTFANGEMNFVCASTLEARSEFPGFCMGYHSLMLSSAMRALYVCPQMRTPPVAGGHALFTSITTKANDHGKA